MVDLQSARAAYQEFKSHAAEPLTADRPPLFSPAAAAQDDANPSSILGRFGPMYMPLSYTDWVDEGQAHIGSAYIGDWSALSKTVVRGSDALAFLGHLGMNDLGSFAVGQVKHHVQLDDNGWVAMEGILLRLDEESFQFSAGSSAWLEWQRSQHAGDVDAEDVSADRFIFGVQGPRSLAVLESMLGEGLRDIRFNRSREVEFRGSTIRVVRTGISGELGYELHGPTDIGNEVWSAVAEAGKEAGLRQLGFGNLSIQHVEAGIATNGLDYFPSSAITPGAPWEFRRGMPGGSFVPLGGFTDYFRRPTELGWGARGGLAREFRGRDALAREAADGGSARVLAGLRWNADDVAAVLTACLRDGELPEPMIMPKVQGPVFDQILVGGALRGVSTGRAMSPNLRATISLAVLDRELAVPGQEVQVLWGRPGTAQREIRATVSDLPFKPDHRRTDVAQAG